MDQPKSLREMRKNHILLVLRAAEGDVERAAEILRISTAELKRRMREYGLCQERKGEDSSS
ncbi:MAG: helix-turn-helix domain-containing protein [Thermodesulfobacteriota bacterium]